MESLEKRNEYIKKSLIMITRKFKIFYDISYYQLESIYLPVVVYSFLEYFIEILEDIKGGILVAEYKHDSTPYKKRIKVDESKI